MLKFVSPRFIVQNVSRKSMTLLGVVPLKPGQKSDLFKVAPNLSESKIIDALASPNGTLYRESQINKNIVIIDCVLNSFHGYSISPKQLNSISPGEEGQVIAINNNDDEFKWAFHNEEDRISVEPPLHKEGDFINIPKANNSTNGYLSKEDWILFKGKSQGIRIWQYQDFDSLQSSFKITQFSNGSSVGSLSFNEDYIVDGSAVLVLAKNHNKAPYNSTSFFKQFSDDNIVKVQQHQGVKVILNQVPSKKMAYRVYFLVVLPHTIDVPADYEAPPKFVRDQRIELMDSIDIDVMGSKIVRGEKTFTNSIKVNNTIGVGVDNPEAELDVNGIVKANKIFLTESPSNYHSLISNTLGEASWNTSPIVSPTPPYNNYNGQLWVKVPEYITLIFDGNREKWLSLNTFDISSAKNSTSCENIYLHIVDNIPTNINGIVLPYDATLVSLIASSQTSQNWTAEVHLEGSRVKDAVLPIMANDRAFNNNLNIDFKAGNKIQLFVSGRDISMPQIKAIFRQKV